ncbi:hypothetical protein YC2023_049349 [Brassica napus]
MGDYIHNNYFRYWIFGTLLEDVFFLRALRLSTPDSTPDSVEGSIFRRRFPTGLPLQIIVAAMEPSPSTVKTTTLSDQAWPSNRTNTFLSTLDALQPTQHPHLHQQPPSPSFLIFHRCLQEDSHQLRKERK